MNKIEDLTGLKFGSWTVIKKVESTKNGMSRYLCKCKCGTEKIVRGNTLKNGNSKSCGCLAKELSSIRNSTHNMRNTRIYITWINMKQRCYNKKHKSYKYYGYIGIGICKEWLNSFKNFYNWSIENGYKENLTIDRIDFNGNYEPDNCRWVDIKTQQNNRRSNVILTYNNESRTMVEWSRYLKIPYRTLQGRRNRGLAVEEILSCGRKSNDKTTIYNR